MSLLGGFGYIELWSNGVSGPVWEINKRGNRGKMDSEIKNRMRSEEMHLGPILNDILILIY